jgi:ATP-dependent DNA helicase RecQ
MAGETAHPRVHPRTHDLSSLLPTFGLKSFRPGQGDIIQAVAAGQDVMCVMPTGGGKSLCFQLPTLAREGITIVVSPLIALMKDQVDSLRTRGIAADILNSTQTLGEQSEVMDRMTRGDVELVYVAPERLRNSRFLELIRRCKVTLLAIDEAHCVSEWGHDFRPDYSRLGTFRKRYLPGVQTIALTATATPMVRNDVIESLGLTDPKTFVTGFARTNLQFSVETIKTDREKQEALVRFLNEQEGAGIVYCATRKGCEEVAEYLTENISRPTTVYHAGLESELRRRVQEAFMAGRFPIIVATNAFGMGIDKSDIRSVVHYNMPGTLEAYYQEAGRAGRDGLNSHCRLLFAYQDRYLQEFFIESRYPSRETVQKVHRYLLSRTEDPIELTLDQVRDAIGVKDSSESIGTAETLLSRAGVLRRMDAASNHIMVRIDSDAPTMLDFLPRDSKRRRQVMAAVEKFVGRRRGEDVFIRPDRLTEATGLDRTRLTNVLRELRSLKAFDYVPPFRGRAIHLRDRETKFDDLQIDFDELDRRKAAEMEKLESVISFARTGSCRQSVILRYFGEINPTDCGSCDRCDDSAQASSSPDGIAPSIVPEGVEPQMLLRGLQVVLSGITRMHGRFGRNLVAQMLCGSKNQKLQGLRLDRLSTYGMLGTLKQNEIVEVIDVLSQAGLVETVEVEQRRPTIQITEAGRRVMHRKDPVPASVRLTFPLAKKLALAAARIEAGDVQTSSAGTDESEEQTDVSRQPATQPVLNEALRSEVAERLKRWRRKMSAALDTPAYRVLTNAVIERLSQQLPQSTAALESVNGIGPATIEQLRYDLVELITQAVTEFSQTQSSHNQSSHNQSSHNQSSHNQSSHNQSSQIPSGDPGGDDRSTQVREKNGLPRNDVHDVDDVDDVDNVDQAMDERNAHRGPAQDEFQVDLENNFDDDLPDDLDDDLSSNPTIDFADETSGEFDDESSAGAVGPLVHSDAYWTWRLFRDGYGAAQIAQIRDRDVDQLVQDLKSAMEEGLDVSRSWLLDPDFGAQARDKFEN